jgi:adenine-specific DNA-methyltransferase
MAMRGESTDSRAGVRRPPSEESLPEPGSLYSALVEGLTARLEQEASRLGFRFQRDRLQAVSLRLLGMEDGEASRSFGRASLRLETAPQDYLHLVSQEIRKRLGQYVTPAPIVRHILEASGYSPGASLVGRTLCDPACGSGVFLVEALPIYLEALERAGVPRTEWYPRVREHLVGIDVDPTACLFARFNLSLLLAASILPWMKANPRRAVPRLRIEHRDTLAGLAAELGGDGFLSEGPAGLPLREAFDFVVGNPPYGKVGRPSASLRRAFEASLYGHANAYGLFLQAGVEMLRPGGRLGFIVPRSMLSGLYFQNLRRLIEERTVIEELTVLSDRKKVFDQVLQGTMIVILRRPHDGNENGASRPIRTGVVRNLAGFEGTKASPILANRSQVVRRLNGTTVWFVSDRERTYSTLDKILSRHPLLGGPRIACPARTGPIVWNRVKPHLRPRSGKEVLPLLWATDVSRFRFEFGTARETRPAWLLEGSKMGKLASRGPSLLVQRVTADEQARRIVASLAVFPEDQRYFVENHLNVLQPADATLGVDLYYLLGVLSSDVVEFLFRSMNGNTQVSATELNLLPVPRGSFELEIADLAGRIETAVRDGAGCDLEPELQERVARAYGLGLRDLRFIQERLRDTATRGGRA